MSDCNVCLSSFDGDSEFCKAKMRTASKTHNCCECGVEIPQGTEYEYASGKSDGDFWTAKTCLVCAEIADTFYCEGRTYGGCLWDELREIAFPEFTSGCVNRLKTAAAKSKLMDEYREWKLG